MNMCHCGSPLSSMWLEEPMVASAFCASGHRLYLFKREDTGAWETPEEKRARMEVTLTCERCEKSFFVASANYASGRERTLCNECVDELLKICKAKKNAEYQLKVRNRENSMRSPWRTFGKTLAR